MPRASVNDEINKKRQKVQIIDIGSTHRRIPPSEAPVDPDPEIAKWMVEEAKKKKRRPSN